MLKLYGIPNCDTVKKARTWLADHNIAVEFHDFKKQGLSAGQVQNWLKQTSWEQLVNRKGMTWRNLPDEVKASITDAVSAQALMLDKTSVIKRPLLEKDGKLLHAGFDAAAYNNITF